MEQTSADIQPKFVDDAKIRQIETTLDTLICYTVTVYMYMCIGLVVPRGRMLCLTTWYLLLQVLVSRPPHVVGKNMFFRFTFN